ncbi:hypothetical protein CF326_g8233 [Tilletia indica]|nr:hypothetical protein CF326_g8233 [Tilletia indica]
MTRAKRFGTAAGGAILLYVLLLLNILPTPLIPTEVREQILPTVSSTTSRVREGASLADGRELYQLPWWTLVSTGSYLLWNMGWGIFNFNDTPQAYQELMVVSITLQLAPMEVVLTTRYQDIKTAKDYLRERGVDVDS